MKESFILSKIGYGLLYFFVISISTYLFIQRNLIIEGLAHEFDFNKTLSIVVLTLFFTLVLAIIIYLGWNLAMSKEKFAIRYKAEAKQQISYYEKEIERLKKELLS